MRKNQRWSGMSAASFLLFAALGVVPIAAAGTPGISLDLHRVTLTQAAAALQKASGQAIGVDPGVPETHWGFRIVRDLRWTNVTPGRALRDLCAAFHVTCTRQDFGYTLEPWRPASRAWSEPVITAPPGAPVFNHAAGRVSLTGSDWGNSMRPHIPGDPPSLGLELLAELNSRDSESISGIGNVIARDDRGNLLTSHSIRSWGAFPAQALPYPDLWHGRVELPNLDLRARKLVSVQGDLLAYRTFVRERLELPWDTASPGVRRRFGPASVQVQCQTGPAVAVHASAPSDRGPGPNYSPEFSPGDVALIGASGRVYQQHSTSSSRTGAGGTDQWQVLVRFPEVKEPVVKVLTSFRIAGNPQPLLTFHLTNVPIPAPPPGTMVPVTAAPTASSVLSVPPGAITLSLTRVNVSEAIAALNRLGRMQLALDDLRGRSLPPDTERTSFQWMQVSYGRAVREVCAAFHLTCMPGRPGLRLLPIRTPASLGRPGVPAFQKDGFRIYRASASWQPARHGKVYETTAPVVALTFPCELDTLDRDAIAGSANLVAQDDRGNLIAGSAPWGTFGGMTGSQSYFPDEWTGRLEFPLPDPRARKLVWVQGDLVGYPTSGKIRFDIPCLPGSPVAHRQVGAVSFEVECIRAADPDRPGHSREHTVAEIRWPRAGGEGLTFEAELVSASGRTYSSQGQSATTGHMTLNFPQINEKVAAVRVTAEPPQALKKLVSFRLSNVSLPSGPPPAHVPPLAPTSVHPGPGPRWRDPGSLGALACLVRIDGKPAPRGLISIGLSAQNGKGWSAVRWLEAHVHEGGQVDIPGIAPGTYQVRRRYQSEPPLPAGHGKWQNETVVIAVPAGRAVELPPLQWVSSP